MAYTAPHAHVTAQVTGDVAARWKASRWVTVTSNVSVVKTQTPGTARRARAHARCLAANPREHRRPGRRAPRNAAVTGTSIVQAKYRSVCPLRTVHGSASARTQKGGHPQHPTGGHRPRQRYRLAAVGARHRIEVEVGEDHVPALDPLRVAETAGRELVSEALYGPERFAARLPDGDCLAADLDHVARRELTAPTGLDLTVHADRAGRQQSPGRSAGVDDVHQLEQLAEPQPAVAGRHLGHADTRCSARRSASV